MSIFTPIINLMNVNRGRAVGLLLLFVMSVTQVGISQTTFTQSNLDLGSGSVDLSTYLQFGPDGRLYVAELYGLIKAYTVTKDGPNSYRVTNEEIITGVYTIPNHDDDGDFNSKGERELTAIVVGGTAANPVIYASSSDPWSGGPGGDINKDTNSGVITRLTWTGSSWSTMDLVRGLPASEENHASHGLELATLGGTDYLILCQGGNTNAGSPSQNFAWTTEYALSAAILAIDLDALNGMSTKNDGRPYKYDLPTVDDPTRPNANGIEDPNQGGYNGIDVGDPWGGNDGLNQAKLVLGGPVQIFSPGYRNTYDMVITESGALYATDNGANEGWGGFPENEGLGGNATNNYRIGEPGSSTPDGGEGPISNEDHLSVITTNINTYVFGSFYGGHPNPIRSNPSGAGIFTRGSHSSDPGDSNGNGYTDDWFRNTILDVNDPNFSTQSLPVDWPPVPVSAANPVEGDYRLTGAANPDGPSDAVVTTLLNNSNGIDEYTASGDMKGSLIIGRSNGSLHRIFVDASGNLISKEAGWVTGLGSDANALGITCNGDNDPFPGTIWVGTFNDKIVILEPNTGTIDCILPGDVGYDPQGDNDSDGYTNEDEDLNGTDLCAANSKPEDFDDDKVSDRLDLDDDNDGINDQLDPYQLGTPFNIPVTNELFNNQSSLKGYKGLGLTGVMNNGSPNPNYLDWVDDPDASNTDNDDILGGAIGAVTIYQTGGDATNNNQEKAFQYGINVGSTSGNIIVSSRMLNPFKNFAADESQGIYIGTGFQDNYVKLILTAGGLEVQGEDNDVALNGLPSAGLAIPSTNLDLFFKINTATGSVQAAYSVDGGANIIDIGDAFTLTGALLTTLQDNNAPLAVGIIGTSGSNPEFAASWDFLNVAKEDDVTEGQVVFRVNAGGETLTAIDSGSDWVSDIDATLAANGFEVNTGNSTAFGPPSSWAPGTSGEIQGATPFDLFQWERWDQDDPEPEVNMTYTFNVGDAGDYTVRLFFRDTYSGTAQPGQRVFSVNINGVSYPALTDIDISANPGPDLAAVIEAEVTIASSQLAVEFFRDQQSPFISGIEIIKGGDTGVPIVAQSVPNQTNVEGDNANITVVASGGDGDLTFTAAGLPSGVSIDPTNGLIGGTIDVGAANGSPYTVIVTVDDNDEFNSDAKVVSFTWTITTNGGIPDSWTNITNVSEHIPRHENSMVQAGDKFYIFGGRESPNIVEEYDYNTNTWSTKSTGPEQFNHFQATTYQGLIWVIGAFEDNVYPVEKPEEFIWIFDPTSNEWIQGPSIPVARRRGSAGLVVYNDKFYIAGGNTIGHDGGYVPWFDEYDPATNTWTTLNDAPNARDHFHATVADGKLYLAGGRLSGGPGGTFEPRLEEVDVYDFTAGTWTTLPAASNLPTPRGGTSTVTFNGEVVVIGGEGDGQAFDNAEALDPSSGTWRALAAMNNARHGTQAIVSGDGIHISSGSPDQGGGSQNNMEVYGIDNPTGTALVSSTLSVPATVSIDAGTTQIITINNTGGNTGIFVTGMSLGGDNGSDFAITAGNPGPFLIAAGDAHQISIINNGSSSLNAATLTINYGEASSATIDINLGTNSSPVASFTATPTSGPAPLAVAFDASASSDPDQGDVLTYSWDFGDGSSGTGVTANHSYVSDGQYTATLTVSDGELTNTATAIITVGDLNTAPVASFTATPTSGPAPLAVAFDASASSDPDQGDVLTYSWDFGDGSSGTGVTANHSYVSDGQYTATLTVSDGELTNTATEVITVGNTSTGQSVYRVNAGGETLTAIDGGTDWISDIGATLALNGFEVTGATSTAFGPPPGWDPAVDADVQGSTPFDLFQWERWDQDDPEPEVNMTYSFNMAAAGTYTVRLYFRDTYSGTAQPGQRVFSVTLDGVAIPALTDIDLALNPGPNLATVIEVETTISDNILDIAFLRNQQSPMISGIEILQAGGGEVPIVVQAIDNQTNEEGAVISLGVQASGGDGALNYAATGLPTGLAIDIGTGLITGTIEAGAIANSPYNVEITVDDADAGNADAQVISFEWVITIPNTNTAPVASFIATPTSGDAPLLVSFDASASSDVDVDDVLTYSWDFGDGNLGTGVTATHTYLTEGVYTATLTVSDGVLTNTATTTIAVGVGNTPPVASFIATPTSGDAPLLVSFDASASSDVDVDDVLTYSWDFGDGNLGTGVTATHTYLTEGVYTATLTVSDGVLTNTATATITVSPANTAPVASFIATPTSGDAPLLVSFDASASSDVDVDDVLTYSWDFGDGNLGTGVTATHTYLTEGVYTATLTVSDGILTNTATATITVSPANTAPVASFIATPTSGNAPLLVSFDASASSDVDVDDVLTYSWDFGDGNLGTGVTATHTYLTEGVYTATLTVSDGVLTNTTTAVITVGGANQPPVAAFVTNTISGLAPLVVNFDGAISSDPDEDPLTYSWDFGDGNSGTGVNVTYTYVTPGFYTATLTVSDGQATSQTSIGIRVDDPNSAPLLAFSANPTTGTGPLLVSFDASGTVDPENDPMTFSWDFGDGASSTDATTSHTFESEGVYTVTLSVSDGALISQGTINIIVEASGCEEVVVNSNDFESGWGIWNDGGSDARRSITDAPFANSGSYCVRIRDNSSTSFITSDALDLSSFEEVNIELNFLPVSMDNAAEDFWLQISTDGGSSWDIVRDWDKGVDFENNERVFETVFIPGPFSSNTKFRFRTDASGNSDWIYLDDVVIRGCTTNGTQNQAPTALFLASTLIGPAPLAVSFDAGLSSDPDGDALTYSWDFGDGNSATGVTTSHVFQSTGTYTVKLTVSDGQASTESVVTIFAGIGNEAPFAAFNATPETGNAPLLVSFDASASSDPDADPLTYSWVFGDGSIGSGVSPTHTYVNGGVYTATLTVSDGQAGTTATKTITVIAPNVGPTASFTATPTSGDAPLLVNFDASGSSDPENDPLTYTWAYGDGGTGTGLTPSHTYLNTGAYTVTLTVSDGEFSSQATQLITVNVPNLSPTASFTATPTSGDVALFVSFDASASSDPENAALSYNWTFGDGNTGTGVTPTHTYTTGGVFTVTLTVSDGQSSDQATTTITVISPNQAPTALFLASTTSGPAPLDVNFDGGLSSDPENDPLTYNWTFGDGGTATGVAPAYQFTTPGVYTVTLTVSDGVLSDQSTTVITVTAPNQGPTASFTATPTSGDAALLVSFDASASSDPENDALSYNWTFGDGSTGSGVAPTHTYATGGVFTVTLTVSDGQTSDQATETITVTTSNQGPTASFTATPTSGIVALFVSFDASGSSDPENDVLSYSWDFGDGNTGTGVTPTYTYTTEGVFTVTLTVSDGVLSSTATATITVLPDGCSVVEVDAEDFEAGWGIWNDGGSDARRNANDADYANSGTYAVRLRDNSTSSHMTTDALDLSSFEDLTVDFSYITVSMDNVTEDFWLLISTDGGASFTEVGEWRRGLEFDNNERLFDQVAITGPFSANTVFRFQCDASNNSDWVYIDDVVISGCTTGATSGLVSSNTNVFKANSEATIQQLQKEELDQVEVVEDLAKVVVFPNPTRDALNIRNLPADASLQLFDLNGKLLVNTKYTETLDLTNYSSGIYILSVKTETAVRRIKVIKD